LNQRLRRKYHRLFKNNPQRARKGQRETNEEELSEIIAVRFDDPREYAL